MAVYLCNHCAGHPVGSLCLHYGMGQIKRYAGSGQLCRMHTIAADSGCRINDGCHLTSGLEQLKADNQSHVSGADHQDPAARLYALNIHHGLRRAGTNNTRNIPALKRNHIFCGTGGNDNGIALIVMHLTALLDSDFFIFINAHDCGVQLYPNAQILCFLQQLLANAEAAHLCVVLLGTEELVNLLEQLSAGALILVKDNDIHAVFLCFNGGAESGRPCADDNEFMSFHLVSPPFSALHHIASEFSSLPPGVLHMSAHWARR